MKYSINGWDFCVGTDVGTGSHTSASTTYLLCLPILCPRYPGGVSARASYTQTGGLSVFVFSLTARSHHISEYAQRLIWWCC